MEWRVERGDCLDLLPSVPDGSVDAVVTDSKGKQVTNLTADDFQVFQDGKPQKITHFSYISTAALTPAPIVPKPAVPGVKKQKNRPKKTPDDKAA